MCVKDQYDFAKLNIFLHEFKIFENIYLFYEI
jgi:hypothetical protein